MSLKCTIPNERGSQEYTKLLLTEVESTIGIMEKNTEVIKKRGDILDVGEIITSTIKKDAEIFRTLAKENKKKQMWENYKMMVIGCTSIAVLSLLVVIVLFFFNDTKDKNSG